MCDRHIDGLPFVLMGYIILDLSIASLFRISVLTEVGCNITFDKHKCTVQYNGKIILSGDKDPSTDLWTLLLGSVDMTTHCIKDAIPLVAPVLAGIHAHLPTAIGCFTHTVQTEANSIRFVHQSLCSPCISTLLKAIRCTYLKRFPNMTAQGVTKYLNPSPATAKGHMKQPHLGICSTQPKPTSPAPLPQMKLPVLPLFQESWHYPGPAYGAMQGNHLSTHCHIAWPASLTTTIAHARPKTFLCCICRQTHKDVVQQPHWAVSLPIPQGQCLLPCGVSLQDECNLGPPHKQFQ
jgi:hypothetical protein